MAEEMKRVIFPLDVESAMLLKIHCAKTGNTMSRFIREAVKTKLYGSVGHDTRKEVHQILKGEKSK